METPKPGRRDVRHVRYSVIGSTKNPNATVLTYGVRPAGTAQRFRYKTVILGRWHRDRSIFKTWIMDWPDESSASTGHDDICDKLQKQGPDAIPSNATRQ